jgi:hypothetical protein
MRKEYGPADGAAMMQALTQAAKEIAREEENTKVQLRLFDEMKAEDSKYKM